MLAILQNFLILVLFFKNIKTINLLFIIFGLTIKNQIYLILIRYNLIQRFNLVAFTFIYFFNKISLFILKKKINTGLLFTKTIVIHLLLFTWILIHISLPNTFHIKFILNLIKICIFFNIAGIYWSIQENLWGGAWDWNLIETTVILITTVLIILLHNKYLFSWIECMIAITFIIYMYYNHIPIITNIHSFTNNKLTKYTFNLLIFFIIVIFFLKKKHFFFLILILWFLQLVILIRFNLLVKLIFISIFIYYLTFKLTIQVYWVFTPAHLIIYLCSSIFFKQSSLTKPYHTLFVILITSISLYQGSYNIIKPHWNFKYNIFNLHTSQFSTFKFNLIKQKKFKILKTVNISYNNNHLITNIN